MSKKKWIASGTAALLLFVAVYMLRGAFPASSESGTDAGDTVLFTDVTASDWFYEDVAYVKNKNLMNGTGKTTFSPDSVATRGMLVTVLWRMEEAPTAEKAVLFTDVASDTYYHDAVAWAAEDKIVSGYSDTSFGPEDSITREQLATVFYRYAAYKNYDVSRKAELDTYADATQISDYAEEALQWANACGIISGTSAVTLEPKGSATRCQIAAILRRFIEQYSTKPDGTQPEETPGMTEPSEKAAEEKETAAGHGRPVSGGAVSSGNGDNVTVDINSLLPKLKVDTVSGLPGDEVELKVSVENNPGILGMILTIGYDESVLMLKSVENGEAVSDFLTLTSSKTLESGARFVWDGLELAPENIKDGTVLLMRFKIADTADEGKYSINFGYADGDIIDNTLGSIYPQMEQGCITVEAKEK